MLTKYNIPDSYVLDTDVQVYLARLYEAVGHSNFVRMSPFLALYYQVCNRINLLHAIYEQMLKEVQDNDSDGSRFRPYSSILAHVRDTPPWWWSGPDSTPFLDDNGFCSRLVSFGPTDDAFSLIWDELIYVHGVYAAFGELRFQVLSRLDTNNTIDHRSTVGRIFKGFKKYIKHNPERLLRETYECVRLPAVKDDCAIELIKAQYKSRGAVWTQRVLNEIRIAHEKGWYVVFDTLTLSDAWVSKFYRTPTALRDYFRTIQRQIMTAEGVPVKTPRFDGYRYFCAPEYGSKEGRLHFHVVHLCRSLPPGTVDPNLNVRLRTKREISSFKKHWLYGITCPLAVRYKGDAFTRAGWLWPQTPEGKHIESKPWQAVAFYVTKYVTKKVSLDMQVNKHLNVTPINDRWLKRCHKLLSYIPRHNFKLRASRNFGLTLPSMDNLSPECLMELMALPFEATPIPRILAHVSRKQLAMRLREVVQVSAIVQIRPDSANLLQLMRSSRSATGCPLAALKAIGSFRPTLNVAELSNETREYLLHSGVSADSFASVRDLALGAK